MNNVLVSEGSSLELALSDANRTEVREAARRGLDFLVRHQVSDMETAEHGRFAYTYDSEKNAVLTRTTNWTTGVGVAVSLKGYQVFGDAAYLEAARRGVSYLRSMQEFLPLNPRLVGVFHENIPQSRWFHPRDALTAAWALLDWSEVAGDTEARFRATAYADWMIAHGMDGGYPRWTVNFDTFDAAPRWYGSFHSGSAFFFARMYSISGDARYLAAMRQILALYNELLLTPEGGIHVIADVVERRPLADAETCHGKLAHLVPEGWIRMHEYNDDFGALANLEAWRLTGEHAFLAAAERFLGRMAAGQNADGGFGPGGVSIPSAGGAVLLEMLAARSVGSALPLDAPITRALDHVLGLQILRAGEPADGAFLGLTGDYVVDHRTCNIRSGGYALLALLRVAGARGPIYFPEASAR